VGISRERGFPYIRSSTIILYIGIFCGICVCILGYLFGYSRGSETISINNIPLYKSPLVGNMVKNRASRFRVLVGGCNYTYLDSFTVYWLELAMKKHSYHHAMFIIYWCIQYILKNPSKVPTIGSEQKRHVLLLV